MVALLFVAATKIVQTHRAADEVDQDTELALFATGPESLIRSLQAERNRTAAYLLDQEALVHVEPGAYLKDRDATDEALVEFRQVIARAGGQIEAAYRPAIEAMSGLRDLRAMVDNYTGPRDVGNVQVMEQVFDGYVGLTNQFFEANRQTTLAVNDVVLRRGAALFDLGTRNSDTVAILTRTVMVAMMGGNLDGVNTPAEISRVSSLLAQLRRNEEAIRENGVGQYRQYVERLFASEHMQRFPVAVQTALDNGTVGLDELLQNAGDRNAFGYDALLDAVKDELQAKADQLKADANWTARLYEGFGLAMLLLGAVTTLVVSQSITRPLRTLTRQATTMANENLPGAVLDILETPLGENVVVPNVAPIRVRTRDEVADVAAALNTVQDSALDLAVEQAVLRRNIADSFVNLGRRNQNLLSRQLDFITELERNETDPDVLASLFRLDHLATRMRRNAESLLVLAGIEPPRKWAAPVAVTDVIRAALSEIEEYQRVNIVSVEPATVVGSAAADLAHLLAELAENAVTFSAADQTVEVRGRAQASGYVLAVIDSGLGMPPDEIERANRRLAGEESFTIAPSKYLGHYVTGNLAARHGINVELHNSTPGGLAPGGITATITLPANLLAPDTVAPRSPAVGTLAGPPTASLSRAEPALAAAGPGGATRSSRPAAAPAAPYTALAAAASALAATTPPGGTAHDQEPSVWGAPAAGSYDPRGTNGGSSGHLPPDAPGGPPGARPLPGGGRRGGSAMTGAGFAAPSAGAPPYGGPSLGGPGTQPPAASPAFGRTAGGDDHGNVTWFDPKGAGGPASPSFDRQTPTAFGQPPAVDQPPLGPTGAPHPAPTPLWPTALGGDAHPSPGGHASPGTFGTPGGGAPAQDRAGGHGGGGQPGPGNWPAQPPAASPPFGTSVPWAAAPPAGSPTFERGAWGDPGRGAGEQAEPPGASWTAAPTSRGPQPPAAGHSSTPPPGGQAPMAFPRTPARGTPPVGGGRTAGGLARRVRGAQAPVTQPLNLRRGPGGDGPGAGGNGGGRAQDRPAVDDPLRPAEDVYSFLSTFHSGVQRGLDQPNDDPDAGEPRFRP